MNIGVRLESREICSTVGRIRTVSKVPQIQSCNIRTKGL